MSRQDLKKAIDSLKSYSTRNDGSSNLTRSFLAEILENLLTNVSKVAESGGQITEDKASFADTVLQFFQMYTKKAAYVFVTSTEAVDGTPLLVPRSTQGEDTLLTFAFNRWCLSKIVWIVAQPSCERVHQKCLDVIADMLQLIRSKEEYNFLCTIEIFQSAAIKLIEISEDLYNGGQGMVLSMFLSDLDTVHRSFKDKVKVNLTSPSFEIKAIEVCECLQLNVTKLLQRFAAEICLYGSLDILWDCMCCHMELGDLELKTESMKVLQTFICRRGLPSMKIMDYLCQIITALLELFISGCEGGDKSKVIDVETETAKLLQNLISADRKKDETYHLSQSHLKDILSKVQVSLATHGIGRLQTKCLGLAVAEMLSYSFEENRFSQHGGFHLKFLRDSLTTSFIVLAGKEKNCEMVIKPLTTLMVTEVSRSPGSVNVSKPEGGKTSSQLHTSRKRKAEPEGNVVKIKSCGVHKQILQRFNEIAFALQQRNVNHTDAIALLEGLWALQEVLLLSHGRLQQNNKCKFPLISWIPLETLEKLISTWQLVLDCPETSQDTAVCVAVIVKSIVSLLATQDLTDVGVPNLTVMCWILSLPWLQNDPSWLDLKLTSSREVSKLSQQLADSVDDSVKCMCVYGLALLPKDVAPKWRIHVYNQVMTDSQICIKRSGVKNFPLLLHQMGPNANHLVHDLLKPLLEDPSPEVPSCVTQVAGILSCVVSRKTILRQKLDDIHSMGESLEIVCITCDELKDEQSCSITKDRPKLVDPNMFSAFLGVINTTNTEAKINLISSLQRIFGHIGVRVNNAATVQMLNICLALMEDPNYNIRLKFSKVVRFLVGEGNDTNMMFMKKLREVTKAGMSQDSQNIRLLETVILTAAQVGCVADSSLFLIVVEFLLSYMVSSIPLISYQAYEQLVLIAKFKKEKEENSFMEARKEISQFVVDHMHQAELSQRGKQARQILKEVATALGFNTVEAFLQVSTKFIIPQLVLKGTSQASTLIKMIATIMQEKHKSRANLLIDHFKYIFSYVVRFRQGESYQKEIVMVNNFLKKETDCESNELVRLRNLENLQELLLHLGTHYKRVFMGLQQLALWGRTPVDIKTTEQMADYLQPHILGVITYFYSNLLSPDNAKSLKKLTLESLAAIIKLMGKKHISRIRHKVYSTLKIGLEIKDTDFNEVNCKAWDCFVRSLETPHLGQMMPQVIAALLPLLDKLPKNVAEIFNFMILEHRETLADCLHEVYFLPDIPELAEAQAVLKQCTEQGPSSQSDLRTKLRHAMKGIQHECLDIRLHALSKLKKLLRDEKEGFHEYVLANETADPVVSELVSVLLKGCRESDPRAQCLYAVCIGEMGAIDPGRLELMTNDPKEDLAKFHASIEDDNFAFGLISEGVKAFLTSSEGITQDCAALALQELLKIYQIPHPQSSAQDNVGKRIWNRLDDQAKQILLPFFNSRYLDKRPWDYSKLKKPIYCSLDKYRNYNQWVCKWTGYLSSKVKQEKPQAVFKACEAVMSNTLDMALYILPFVVFQIIVDGTDKDREEIFLEVKEVLNQTVNADGKSRLGNSNAHHLATQTICSVIDYLEKWRRYKAHSSLTRSTKPQELQYLADEDYRAVDKFLQQVPHYQIANACFKCKAFTRSLLHIELYLQEKKENLQDHLDFIQRLYQAMDESDGVVGVSAIRQTSASVMEQILIHESLGQHQDAQACYEKAVQSEPDEVSYHQGLLNSLMELGQVNKALLHATGAVAKKSEWGPQLQHYMVEAAWKLGQWQELETCVKSDKNSRTWSVGIGKALIAARDKKEDEFLHQLEILRQEQMGPLSAASMETGSYLRGYQYIVRLHMVNELEEGLRLLLDLQSHTDDGERLTCARSVEEMIKNWEARIQITQCSFRTEEPILILRRTLFKLAQNLTDRRLDHEIGHWWLLSAKIAREACYIQTAYSALLQASDYKLPEVFLEEAKWLWHKGSTDQALTCLERGMSIHFPDVDKLKMDESERGLNHRKIYAEALLLYGRYSDETSNIESNAILKRYREVTEAYNDYEDGHFYMANYYDKIMTTILEDKSGPDPSKQGEFVMYVVKHLGYSLLYGNQFIYQSLPRLLTLWLDYGTGVVDMERKEKQNIRLSKLQPMRNVLGKLNKIIDSLGKQLAPYQLYTAFSQMVSRICHTQPDVFQKLKDIIARIFVHFPQQALWNMMAVSKSSYQVRVNRCKEIFATAVEMNTSLRKFIQDATKLTERLLELCEKEEKSLSMSMSQHFKPLKRLLENSNFSQILLPLQSAMTVTLPTTPGSHREHNPFPSNQVYLHSFQDTIEIMPSLQKPKKITMIGSDGKYYVMMCKPKDDLRKDCRLMEFNAIVNKFLNKDPESRKRELHIRTYSVIPLNEECGLIEWVGNTHGFRHILLKLYKEKGKAMTGRELQSAAPPLSSSLEVKMQVYKEKYLPRYPSVFKEWFYRTFPDPTSWYNARLAYAHTTAVMSMVGYILGLGDRHGENILFDSTCGDCVHVDLNCLFNKGETFEWPEKVPFRLTHNMVDALGPMGFEGIFRRSCEVTLRVMRNQTDPLMSVLKPFIYDPLVEWSKGPKGQKSNPVEEKAKGEITNDQALTHVQNIEHRLKGILKSRGSKPRSVPLSIEGHVNYLLQEATDMKNLCQMYVGWAAYM